MLGDLRIDRHAADRVDDAAFGRRVMMMSVAGGHAHGAQLSLVLVW
jgi:hypothetical protein